MKQYSVVWQKVKDPVWFAPLFYIYVTVATTYIIWRSFLINWQVWYGPLLYLAELYGYIATLLFVAMARQMYIPMPRHARAHKTVDVLICTYNEPLSILQPVVEAARLIRGVGQVLVLDDGNRPEIKAMAEQLEVQYHPRKTNQHAKAGNLNNGLGFTRAEFLVLLDADHVPQPDFIEQTLGFFDDPAVGLVQTPQTFYNTDSFLFRQRHGQSAGWSEQTMFYDCIQPAKNRWNAAFFVGTSAMLRRSALDSVDGFATGTATEDIHTSLRLHAKGWKSVFLPKPLAYGLEATSFKEFYKQRKRWAAGSLGLLMRSPDSPLRCRGLNWRQRLSYLSATMAHLQGVQRLCFYMVPILALLWGISPVDSSFGQYSLVFLGYFIFSVTVTSAYARGTYHLFYNETYAIANMLAHFGGIKGVLKVQKKFAVSNKRASRKERTWLSNVLWGFLVVGLLALIDDAWQYVALDRFSALSVYSFVFIAVNCVVLGMFLRFLRNYENAQQLADQPLRLAVSKHRHFSVPKLSSVASGTEP